MAQRTFEVKIQTDLDTKREKYHIYVDGTFFITCTQLKDVAYFKKQFKEGRL